MSLPDLAIWQGAENDSSETAGQECTALTQIRMPCIDLTDWIAAQKLPEPFSGVISLTRPGMRLEGCFGHAIRALELPNTADTRFQMASGCKVFTAVAVSQLMEQGRVTEHTRLLDCVDADLPHIDPRVTLHQRLTHTSGMPDYFDEAVMHDYADVWRDRPMYQIQQPRDFLPLFNHLPMVFSPGERFAYNISGFILLGLVVEALTGQSFASYVRQHVFTPAGMTDSGYFRADDLPDRTAYAYLQRPDGSWSTNIFSVPVMGGPDGGAYTTAPDMERFWKALSDGTRLSPEWILQLRVATGRDRPHTHYGYGVWIEESGSERAFFVEGSDPGVVLRSWFVPDSQTVLTVMGNTGGAAWHFLIP